MKFITAFYNSLFNVNWLKKVRTRSGPAWSYFFIFILILSAFYTIPVLFALSGGVQEAVTSVQNYIPSDFKAEVKEGQLSISGVVQPLIIRDPKSSNFVIVIDTVATSSLSLSEYLHEGDRGGFLVTRDKIETYNPPRSQIVYIRDLSDFIITKTDVLNVVRWFTGTTALIITAVIMVVLVFIGITIWKLWVILFVVLIATLISALFRRGWKFGELFVVGLYAITLSSVISFVLFALGVSLPWLHFIIMLAFMLAIVLTKSIATPVAPSVSEDKSQTPTISS
jgi:hypothetical protein